MHVLFVDDETTNRRLGGKMLQRLGCTNVQIADGDEVLRALEESAAAGRPFDAVLMDIVMPRKNGVEACEELRRAGWDVSVIAMTGQTASSDVSQYVAAGFDVMLPKPFDVRAMQKALVEAKLLKERTAAADEGVLKGTGAAGVP
jgi:CheY-like chemotaxis protein